MTARRYKAQRITRAADGLVGGVCAGLGRHLGVSANILRLGWLVAVLFFGTGILVYLALWWIIPHEQRIPIEPTIWKRNGGGSYSPPLRRTGTDRKLLGVCGGVARRFGLDPSLVRLGTLALATLSLGLVVLVYLIAAIFIEGPEGPSMRVDPVEL